MRGPCGLFATVLLLLSATSTAEAWCRMTTSLRSPTAAEPCVLPDENADPPEFFLEWERPCSGIALSVVAPSADLEEEDVRAVVSRSIATWSGVSCDGQSPGISIELMEPTSTCDVPLYRDGGSNVNSLMFIAEWDRSYDPAAYAVTTVWHRRSTGEILDVDMEVNEERGPFGVCPETGCEDMRTVDLENVLTHEFGHYLGLAHTTDPEATMFASAVAGEILKRDLGSDDIAGICAVYPAGTPTGECDPAPRGGLRLDCGEGGSGCSAIPSTRPGARSGLLLLPLLGWLLRRRPT